MQPCRRDPGGLRGPDKMAACRTQQRMSTWYCADRRCTGRSWDISIPNINLLRPESSGALAGPPCLRMPVHYSLGSKVTWPAIRKHQQVSLDLFIFHQEFSTVENVSSLRLCQRLIEPQRRRTSFLIQSQPSSRASSSPFSNAGFQAEA